MMKACVMVLDCVMVLVCAVVLTRVMVLVYAVNNCYVVYPSVLWSGIMVITQVLILR